MNKSQNNYQCNIQDEINARSHEKGEVVQTQEDHLIDLPRSFVLNHNISSNSRLLYIILKSLTNNQTGKTSPSRQLLLELLGCSDASLSKHLNELKELGYLEINKSQTNTGTFKRNEYTIIWPADVRTKSIEKREKEDAIEITSFGRENINTNNNITELITESSALILNLASVASLYPIIKKFRTELGESELKRIISYLKTTGKNFNNLHHFAAYLAGAVKKQKSEKGKPHSSSENEPGWM